MEQPLAPPTHTTLSSEPMGEQLERPAVLVRSLKLMKPVTWFGPIWAFMCGAIASGGTSWELTDMTRVILGMVFAGPILCGLSQIINDYFDREVDALNEPHRLIPAGLVSMQQIAITVVVLFISGVAIAMYLGRGVFILTGIGLFFAFVYSAPPLRAKRNGWVGNSLVAISYEGLAWMAGHLAFAALTPASVVIALLYSFGTHGIMSINDYKSIEGDSKIGIKTIPVLYGVERAAWLIVFTMNIAQIGVIALFVAWANWLVVGILAVILFIQLPLQRSFLRNPMENYLKFSAIGVNFFVWGMLVAAIGTRGL